MIAGQETEVAVIPGSFVSGEVILQKSCDIAMAILFKEAVVLLVLIIPHQGAVAVAASV